MRLSSCFALLLASVAFGSSQSPTNLVEPLSNGLLLSMSREEIEAKFGPPTVVTWDPHIFGYDGFLVQVGGWNQGIWHLTLKKNVALSSGVGVGSSRQQVRRAFGKENDLTYQRYKLRFSYAADNVQQIEIEPALGDFAADSSALGTANGKDAVTKATKAAAQGTWRAAADSKQVTLNPDETYVVSDGGRGRYTVNGMKILFTGVLSSWGQGRARLENGDITFHWRDRAGGVHYVALTKRDESD